MSTNNIKNANQSRVGFKRDMELQNIDTLLSQHMSLIPRLGKNWNKHSLNTPQTMICWIETWGDMLSIKKCTIIIKEKFMDLILLKDLSRFQKKMGSK